MEIPKGSLLHSGKINYDYIDSYEYIIKDLHNKLDIEKVTEVFSQPGPKWFEKLFWLRDKIASIFKLKTSETTGNSKNRKPDTQAGIFRILDKTATEIIMGEDDKHLNFKVSLLLNQGNDNYKSITVTTAVALNNLLGKIYFFIIKPFHKAIIPRLLKRKFKQMEKELNT